MAPLPKNAATRQRRNRSSSASTLFRSHDVEAPALPPLGDDVPWHSATLGWWRDVWASPMAPEFDESDRHGLFLLAVLVDAFWKSPSQALAAEIRLQRQCFGLTPIDRRRLQWEIERSEEAQDRGEKRRNAVKPSEEGDPRAALRAV